MQSRLPRTSRTRGPDYHRGTGEPDGAGALGYRGAFKYHRDQPDDIHLGRNQAYRRSVSYSDLPDFAFACALRCSAQRFFCAAAMRLRAEALSTRFFAGASAAPEPADAAAAGALTF